MVRKTPSNRSNLPFWAAAHFKFMQSTFWTTRGRKRERQVMPPLVLLIKFVRYFWYFSRKFLFKSVGRQLVTFARILVAQYFFHSPWRPKWSQLGALKKYQLFTFDGWVLGETGRDAECTKCRKKTCCTCHCVVRVTVKSTELFTLGNLLPISLTTQRYSWEFLLSN